MSLSRHLRGPALKRHVWRRRATNAFLNQLLRHSDFVRLTANGEILPLGVVDGRVRFVLCNLTAGLVFDGDNMFSSFANHGAGLVRRNRIVNLKIANA